MNMQSTRMEEGSESEVCKILRASHASTLYSLVVVEMLLIVSLSKLLHVIFRRILFPRLLCDLVVVAVAVNQEPIRRHFRDVLNTAIDRTGELIFAFYLFVLGLEMDPRLLCRRSPGPHVSLAYLGILSNILLTLIFLPVLVDIRLVSGDQTFVVISAFAISMATTSSHVLARLATELKFSRTFIGRYAMTAAVATDMAGTILMVAGYTFYLIFQQLQQGNWKVLIGVAYVGVQLVFIMMVVSPAVDWLNERCPEGKPLKGPQLALGFSIPAAFCFFAAKVGYDWKLNAFLVGLALPSKGRISGFLISRINFALTYLVITFYYVVVFVKVEPQPDNDSEEDGFSKIAVTTIVGVMGKAIGVMYAAIVQQDIRWEDAFRISILLNVKGPYHFFCVHMAISSGFIQKNTLQPLIFSIMASMVLVPLMAYTVRPVSDSRKRRLEPTGVQWHDHSSELQIVVGLQGARDVPMAVTIVEAMRPGSVSVALHVIDMIQMTERAAAMLVHGQSADPEAMTVLDEGIMATREDIGAGLDAYKHEAGEAGLTIRHLFAIASFDDMHHDLCDNAKDTKAVLILLPYHRRQMVDGMMSEGNSGFRRVNRRILRDAPCSVGIMVDRDPVRSKQVLTSMVFQNIAVVFIGGKDDREALAIAGLIVQHSGIRLILVRFLADPEAQEKANRMHHHGFTFDMANNAETRADAEYLSAFRERNRNYENLAYLEMQVSNGAETVAALRSLGEQNELFIVGRGLDRGSVVTTGMSDWVENADLGPVGDMLASSDFTTSASVLAHSFAMLLSCKPGRSPSVWEVKDFYTNRETEEIVQRANLAPLTAQV